MQKKREKVVKCGGPSALRIMTSDRSKDKKLKKQDKLEVHFDLAKSEKPKKETVKSPSSDMISRKSILLKAAKTQPEFEKKGFNPYEDEEDVWFDRETLFKDHLQEILHKWTSIDDEIWGKIICMEKNRRTAKAYVRAPIISINGSEDGFDGYRIGLNGFDNPMRERVTEQAKKKIGQGVRIKMDDLGNIIIKRLSKSEIYIRGWDQKSNALSKEIVAIQGNLEFEVSTVLFDLQRFRSNIEKEVTNSYPDRKKLEAQCVLAIGFARDSSDLLGLPSWVMLINVVALDLLKTKLPLLKEENPYSIPGNITSSSYSESPAASEGYSKMPLPPALPPRDAGRRSKTRTLFSGKESNDEDRIRRTKNWKVNKHHDEDPYYSGLEARVSAFARPGLVRTESAYDWQPNSYVNHLLAPRFPGDTSFYRKLNSSDSPPESDMYAISSGDSFEQYPTSSWESIPSRLFPLRFQKPKQPFASQWD